MFDWKGVRFDLGKPPKPHNYPVPRGTYIPVDRHEALLWTQGSVVGVHDLTGAIAFIYYENCFSGAGLITHQATAFQGKP